MSETRETHDRAQIAFMECRNGSCKGEGRWFNDSGNREWFVYEGDPADGELQAMLIPSELLNSDEVDDHADGFQKLRAARNRLRSPDG